MTFARLFLYFCIPCLLFCADDKAPPCPPKEEFAVTEHKIAFKDASLTYQATVGNLLIPNERCEPKASIFFTSYTKVSDNPPSLPRPVTFCFNGGPGSSSVWLHLGALGPQKVLCSDLGEPLCPPQLVDNEASILEFTDLVFIDPVSTGFSSAIPVENASQFHGTEEDVKCIGEFIRLYLTRYARWDSPKFIVGESYGTTRAALLAKHLHDDAFISINGIVLISTVLNFQTLDFSSGNDLPYLLFLPTYTATAWYHKKLPPLLQEDLEQTLHQVKEFIAEEYTAALFKGDTLSSKEKRYIAMRLSYFTGLSEDYLLRNHLRIPMLQFGKELLRNQDQIVGRFDSRFVGIDDATDPSISFDPSADAIFGAFTAAINHYLRTSLQCKQEHPYKVLTNVQPWNYNSPNKFLNVSSALQETMTKNPSLRVLIANGQYDLATPPFATEYTLNHLQLNPKLRHHLVQKTYAAGHMMYLYRPALMQMKQDLEEFYRDTLIAQSEETHFLKQEHVSQTTPGD